MSEVSLIKKFDHSVGNIPFISFDLPHVSDYYCLEVFADSSEVIITHDFFNKIIEFIKADISLSKRYPKFSSGFSGDKFFLKSGVFLSRKQCKYSTKLSISLLINRM